MRLQCWLLILALAQSTPAPPVSKVFMQGVGKYVQMQQGIEGSVPAQKPTNESELIAERQQQLSGAVATESRTLQQGEIFTLEVAEEFRTIIRKAFQEPGGQAMRKTIQESDSAKPVTLKVNEVYPEDRLRTTMPPTLLSRLPILPKELAYRIIGRALVLEATKSGLIVDFIPNAIP